MAKTQKCVVQLESNESYTAWTIALEDEIKYLQSPDDPFQNPETVDFKSVFELKEKLGTGSLVPTLSYTGNVIIASATIIHYSLFHFLLAFGYF